MFSLVLDAKIDKRAVRCEGTERDRYQRLIAECFVADESLNTWMVRSGWAVAYRNYSRQYVKDEIAARRETVGIWAGRFQVPWKHRRQASRNIKSR